MASVHGSQGESIIQKDGSPSRSGKTILLVSTETVAGCLTHAMEREFPWIRIEHLDSLEAACAPFSRPVVLIMADSRLIGALEALSASLGDHHPSAAIVLMQDDGREPFSLEAASALPFLRGILPMNMKLDIWLSIIHLMLNGGEYFPRGSVDAVRRRSPEASPPTPAPIRSIAPAYRDRDPGDDDLAGFDLTMRELEVLEVVSRGHQNKIIAAMLGLAENTVKIHIHNIITKLGVHNRTEAAGLFWSRRGSVDRACADKEPPAPSPPSTP